MKCLLQVLGSTPMPGDQSSHKPESFLYCHVLLGETILSDSPIIKTNCIKNVSLLRLGAEQTIYFQKFAEQSFFSQKNHSPPRNQMVGPLQHYINICTLTQNYSTHILGFELHT